MKIGKDGCIYVCACDVLRLLPSGLRHEITLCNYSLVTINVFQMWTDKQAGKQIRTHERFELQFR